jgi:DNA-binding protein HU-beta
MNKGGISMNKTLLISKISEKTNLMKKDVEAVVNQVIDTASRELSKGGKVTMVGFGTFKVTERKPRNGVNPKTGAKIKIAGKKVPVFKPGKELKEKVK